MRSRARRSKVLDDAKRRGDFKADVDDAMEQLVQPFCDAINEQVPAPSEFRHSVDIEEVTAPARRAR